MFLRSIINTIEPLSVRTCVSIIHKCTDSCAEVTSTHSKVCSSVCSDRPCGNDMVHFLTKNHRFGVLTADTTYNLGDFCHSPLMLGPVLIHQRVDFTAFNYFASTLVGCR